MKMKIKELFISKKLAKSTDIPDYVPKNQYVVFVKNIVVAIGPTPCDLAEIALQKFPNLPIVIKFNGPKRKQMEYCYALSTDLKINQ
ncbi:MAG: hypothetical protein LUQ65_11390 [Candidatus Helarchaeota archaeon]|nr:hypothetical protein [Candidatus Helarchaeota archaeon]